MTDTRFASVSRRFRRLGTAGLCLLLTGSALAGCSTPVYSFRERSQIIARNWSLETQMLADDIDSVLLLRPVSGLTMWNIP